MENSKNNTNANNILLRAKFLTIFACLFIALIFWIFNALSHDNATTIDYPVEIELDSQKYTIHGSTKKNIKVVVSGYGWTLLSRSLGIGNSPILLFPSALQNNKIDVQNRVLPILKERIKDIKIVQIMEDSLHFDIEKRITKKVYLKLDKSKLSLPSNAKIDGKIKIQPSFVVCNGSEKNILTLPDSIFFSLPDQFIENNYTDFVDINYRPFADISLNYSKVKVSFLISKN